MWGLLAIRVGVLALATVASAGCCETCKLRCKDEAKPAPAAINPTLEWDRRALWNKDQPEHLTPERVHGEIY